ncbi:dihydrodipicolinate synthase family protein [Vineibacter terrae]|uniref:Dihydrodipicolinate synthase family protein n=1 Tax=Vineibacter terrae TaxID=2586908 RepID=A0A5C8PTN0_9HYPH|nr:dihydrodipicolinate synthase family protein [Vineibacter terrae]
MGSVVGKVTREAAAERLKGLFNITVTPFAADGGLDRTGLAQAIERAIAAGYDGVLIGGTYGEFATMTADERASLFRAAMGVVADRVPVLLCSAAADTRVAAELSALAVGLGGIPMVMPPYVSEVTEAQVEAFFRTLCAQLPAVVIYNAPGIGITLAPGLIARLADIPGIVGLKQGELAPTVVDELVGRVGGRIRLFCASDLQMLGPVVAGFDGVSSTNSCALPELIRQVYTALASGDAARAGALQRSWYRYRAFARATGQPQTVKAAMRIRSWNGGHVRAPLTDLAADRVAELEAIMAELLAHPAGTLGRAA